LGQTETRSVRPDRVSLWRIGLATRFAEDLPISSVHQRSDFDPTSSDFHLMSEADPQRFAIACVVPLRG